MSMKIVHCGTQGLRRRSVRAGELSTERSKCEGRKCFSVPFTPVEGGMGRAWRLALGEEDDRHIEKDVVGRGSAVFRRRSVFHQSKPYASNISRGRGDIFLYMHLSVRSLLVVYSYSDRLLKTKELPRAVFPLWSMWDEGASAVEFDLFTWPQRIY